MIFKLIFRNDCYVLLSPIMLLRPIYCVCSSANNGVLWSRFLVILRSAFSRLLHVVSGDHGG